MVDSTLALALTRIGRLDWGIGACLRERTRMLGAPATGGLQGIETCRRQVSSRGIAGVALHWRLA